MKWSFSYNSFVKFHGKKFRSHKMTVLLCPNPCYNMVKKFGILCLVFIGMEHVILK